VCPYKVEPPGTSRTILLLYNSRAVQSTVYAGWAGGRETRKGKEKKRKLLKRKEERESYRVNKRQVYGKRRCKDPRRVRERERAAERI